jgi:exosortase A
MEQRKMSNRRSFGLALLAGLGLLGWSYRDTFLSIVDKWASDSAFSHGFLIVPIALWLAWRKRDELAATPLAPSWLGLAAAVACIAAWIVARGSGVLVIEQFAAVAMVPALVLAVLGWPATRTLSFPLAFLFFAVPFGRAVVPLLMELTAHLASLALQWTGVPVLRSHMYISIPEGNFEVAKACSGIKYFIAGTVLGLLYAHLNYRSWKKRILCVAAFTVIPVLLNSARVYLIIAVSHLTDMRFGPGQEHVTFGMIFFVAVMGLMFWVGRRWSDYGAVESGEVTRAVQAADASPSDWLLIGLVIAAIAGGPTFHRASVSRMQQHMADPGSLVVLPAHSHGWTGPADGEGRWQPNYVGGVAERQVVYAMPDGAQVDVFVAVFGLGTSLGAEMISYQNVIDAGEYQSLSDEHLLQVEGAGGKALTVREVVVDDAGVPRRVWYWYVVGDRPAHTPFVVKILEALAFVTGGADSERIVALSTKDDTGASSRLSEFLVSHGSCVVAGLAPEPCSR